MKTRFVLKGGRLAFAANASAYLAGASQAFNMFPDPGRVRQVLRTSQESDAVSLQRDAIALQNDTKRAIKKDFTR
jgi:hypothetical protein